MGFTYLGIILAVALLGAVLGATGTVWSHVAQRERERELLHIGNQYRRAIGLYYERTPGTVKRYPPSLKDLLLDTRHLTTQQYLRRIYTDPMTGNDTWGIVRAPDGGIMGVHSTSEVEPIKKGNFSRDYARFANAGRYADWHFVYVPATGPSVAPKPPTTK